jgi:hypothetical protein
LAHTVWRSPLVEIERRRALLRVPTVGRFLASLDGLPTVQRLSGIDGTEAEYFASRPVPALQALLGGHFALRGSAVLVNDQALLVTGYSGVGKSALAAALTRSGTPVLADAYVFVDAGTPPTLRVTRTTLDLWPDTVEALGMDDTGGLPLRAGLAKRSYAGPPTRTGPTVPVGKVVILGVGSPRAAKTEVGAHNLHLPAAIELLTSLGYLSRAVDALGFNAEHFAWLTSLLSLRPVEIWRPGGNIAESLDALAREVLEK